MYGGYTYICTGTRLEDTSGWFEEVAELSLRCSSHVGGSLRATGSQGTFNSKPMTIFAARGEAVWRRLKLPGAQAKSTAVACSVLI